ncbi:MAG: type II toxin-antitoxin system RelE/ParE family toxin [Proteobacteria bacterium]|nr:type II toxin-antitoxin system RelE/ParE family toxin [Pseudomonadota bacterium]
MRVVVVAEAQAEFDEAVDYYRTHASASIAEGFVDDFERALRLLIENPEIGSHVSKRSRGLVFRRFPYKLVYQITADAVVIKAIAHQRRRPNYWRRRQ